MWVRRQRRDYQNSDISAQRNICSIVREHRAWKRQPTEFVKTCLPHGCLLFVPEVQPCLENQYSLKGLFSLISFKREQQKVRPYTRYSKNSKTLNNLALKLMTSKSLKSLYLSHVYDMRLP